MPAPNPTTASFEDPIASDKQDSQYRFRFACVLQHNEVSNVLRDLRTVSHALLHAFLMSNHLAELLLSPPLSRYPI